MKANGPTAYTNRRLRWLVLKEIDPWFPRPNARKANRPPTVNIEQKGPETVEEQDLPPAQREPCLNNLSGGLFNGESHFSTETLDELEIPPYTQYYAGQQSMVFPVPREQELHINGGPHLGSRPSFAYDPYVFTANAAFPPIFPHHLTEQYIEDHNEPEGYGGLTFSAVGTSSAGDFLGTSPMSSNTSFSLFDEGGFLSDMIN